MEYITCPKCKEEARLTEGTNTDNNPNLQTCESCGHSFWIVVKYKIHKAHKNSDGGYSFKKSDVY